MHCAVDYERTVIKGVYEEVGLSKIPYFFMLANVEKEIFISV
jgi:hypothetical protein